MADQQRPLGDADLRSYLVARADATARGAGRDMVERVAIGVGVLAAPRRTRERTLRVVIVVAILAALLAIAIGVGVLPPPAPQPTRDPSATPVALQQLAGATFPGAAQIAAARDSIWVADRDGTLAELDPGTGAVGRSIDLPRAAADLLVTADSVWASSSDGDLVRVDRGSLAITPIPGAIGIALAEGLDAVWLGADDGIVRVDPATNGVAARASVPGRSADLGIATTDGAVWVATRTAIVRLDPATGAQTGSIPGDAARLATTERYLWATRGTELLRIDAVAPRVLTFSPGFPVGTGFVAGADSVWVGGPPGGGGAGRLLGASVVDGGIDVATDLPASVLDLAVGSGVVWATTDEDAGNDLVYRFAVP